MPNINAFIALLGLLLYCLSGAVQALSPSQYPIKLNAKSYGLKEGLSQFAVSSITEDKDGYVWVGTLNGLNRYNGQKFRHFFAGDGSQLPSSFVRRLYTDTEGRLFVGTDNGLVVYDDKQESFITPGKLGVLDGHSISSISEVENKILISTSDTAYLFSRDFETVAEIYSSENVEIKDIKSVSGILYVLTYDDELLIVKDNQTDIIKDVLDISVLGKNLYAATLNDTKVFNGQIYDTLDMVFSKLSEPNNGQRLVATDGRAVFQLNDENIFEYIGNLWRADLDISTIEFMGNSIYIATYNRGFYSTSPKANLLVRSAVVEGFIWDVKSSPSGNIIISDDTSVLKVLDSSLNLINHFDTGINGPKKLFINQNNIYISSQQGLYLLSKDNTQFQKILDGRFSAIDGFGDELVLASGFGHYTLYNLIDESIVPASLNDDGFPIFDFSYIGDENKKSLWIASQGGLYKQSDGKVTLLHKGFVTSLLEDGKFVYFGTNSGLSRIDKNTNQVEVVLVKNKPVYSIISDKEKIYASSDKEVIVFDTNSMRPMSINSDYGSQDEYNLQAIEAVGDSIVLGGTDGISIFTQSFLDKVTKYYPAPVVNFEDLKVFNQTEKVGGEFLTSHPNYLDVLKLKYSDYPFTLTFSSPRSPDSTYFYQLDGLSENYVKAVDINAATYTNLSPGFYTLNVYASDNLTNVKGEIKSLKINVTPPWWLSIQAKLVYFAIFVLITAITIKAVFRRREVQKKIAQSEERLKLSLWGSGDEMWDWDIESGQIYRSNIWGSLDFPKDGHRSGEPDEESNIHVLDRERVKEALNSHFDGVTDHFEATYRVKGKDGTWIWILDRAKIVERDEDDLPLRMTGTIKNISTFKQTEEQLKLFERAIRNMSEGMFILDDKFYFVAVNDACCQLSLRPKEQFIGSELNFDLYPEHYSTQIKQMLLKQGRWYNDVEAHRGDGTSFLMELTIDAIYSEQGVISHYVGVFSDITRRKTQEEELRKLTNNDVLTGLPNRSNMQVTLSNLVKKDSHHTLMVIDLDNFKKINDSLGHQIGDELLVQVAKRIEQAIPKYTGLYRLGGDEFAILEDKFPDIGSGATMASRIIESFSTPFEIAGEKLVIGLSIGIVLYPEDEQNEQALLRKADIAMYHAKSAGGNRYQFYSESLNKNAMRQLEIENLIREGLRKDYFQVHYQPKYDIKSNRLTGMEALVRLAHPERGLIPPGEFIPLAEETGLIVEIGDLVLKKACFAAQSWREQGLFNGRVAVNLSSHQFALPDLHQRIDTILTLTRLPAANLELEITEGTVIKEPEKAIKVMQQLAKMGVSLALDDFGTGYSSLSYLKRFPINTLKIDKAFVDDIDKSDRDLKMVDSIITIAHNMGLSVVGEGVELSAQLSLLKALNCEEIQGFLYSKALPENDFTRLLEQQEKVKNSAAG